MKMVRLWHCSWPPALAVVMLSACDGDTSKLAPAPAPVAIVTLVPADVGLFDELPGRVAAVRTAEIRPQVGGIIQRRLFDQGAEIRAGQPLFQINPAPFKAEADMAAAALQRAEAALTRAQVQTARLEPLVKVDAVSGQVYDDAASQRDQAAADVAQARATLARRQLDVKFAMVDAPISGRIDQALVTEGALVAPNDSTPMARIQQIDQVYVDVRQPASVLESLRNALVAGKGRGATSGKGLPATILRSGGEADPMAGHILFSGVNVDAGTGDVLVRIMVENPGRQLLPGMFVRARVPRGSYADALLVPQQAVSHAGATAQVWVIDEQNKARAVAVQVGELVDRQYRVRSGLAAGQRIVVEGLERLSDGALVAPQAWRAPEAAAGASNR